MMWMQIISYIFFSLGIFFILTSVIGAIRMPDFYTRIHALSIGDVCGVPIFLIGLIFKIGFNSYSFKIMLLISLIIIISPTATYILVKSAYQKGVKPLGKIEESKIIQEQDIKL